MLAWIPLPSNFSKIVQKGARCFISAKLEKFPGWKVKFIPGSMSLLFRPLKTACMSNPWCPAVGGLRYSSGEASAEDVLPFSLENPVPLSSSVAPLCGKPRSRGHRGMMRGARPSLTPR